MSSKSTEAISFISASSSKPLIGVFMGKPGPGPIVGLDYFDRCLLSSRGFLRGVETALLDELKLSLIHI